MRSTVPLIFACACVEGISDYHLVKYARGNDIINLGIGCGGYALLIYLLIQIWKEDSLSMSNVLWNSFSTVINGIVGVGMLGETLSDKEIAGSILSLSGMGLIASDEAKI
jgi:multidrug transporter EmrE-like cation transporter